MPARVASMARTIQPRTIPTRPSEDTGCETPGRGVVWPTGGMVVLGSVGMFPGGVVVVVTPVVRVVVVTLGALGPNVGARVEPSA